jgi:hypothetical protein
MTTTTGHTADTQSEFAFELRPARLARAEVYFRALKKKPELRSFRQFAQCRQIMRSPEPEQRWGTQEDLRRHIRFGGTLENY